MSDFRHFTQFLFAKLVYTSNMAACYKSDADDVTASSCIGLYYTGCRQKGISRDVLVFFEQSLGFLSKRNLTDISFAHTREHFCHTL